MYLHWASEPAEKWWVHFRHPRSSAATHALFCVKRGGPAPAATGGIGGPLGFLHKPGFGGGGPAPQRHGPPRLSARRLLEVQTCGGCRQGFWGRRRAHHIHQTKMASKGNEGLSHPFEN